MHLYRLLKLVAIFGVVLTVACEPPEPVAVSSGVTFDASCDPYKDTLQGAITYIVAHADRMKYNGGDVAKIVSGEFVSVTIRCVSLASDDAVMFGQAWRNGNRGIIELNKDTVLTKQWYHPLFAKPGFDGTTVFSAGILAHEATHVWDFFTHSPKSEECVSPEAEPDRNQYQLWGFGNLIADAVACYDSTRRGCGTADNHMEAALLCVFN